MATDASLPPGLMASLAVSRAPRALLIRHSDRAEFVDGVLGPTTPLTSLGERRARALGAELGELAWALTSPVLRCIHTADLMGTKPIHSDRLGAPGAFAIDPEVGAQVFLTHGTREVVYRQLRGETWQCMRPMAEGARIILDLLRENIGACEGTGLAVSHDAIVMPFIAWATGYDFTDDWLDPLEGIVVCKDSVVWRGKRYETPEC